MTRTDRLLTALLVTAIVLNMIAIPINVASGDYGDAVINSCLMVMTIIAWAWWKS